MVEIKCVLNGVTLAPRTPYYEDEKVHRCLKEAKDRLCALTGLSHNQLALKVVPIEEADGETVVIGQPLAATTAATANTTADTATTTAETQEQPIDTFVLFEGSSYIANGLQTLLTGAGLPDVIAKMAVEVVNDLSTKAKLISNITLSNDGLTFVFDNGMLKQTVKGRILALAKKAVRNGTVLRTVTKTEDNAAEALKTHYLPPQQYTNKQGETVTPPHKALLSAFCNAVANLKPSNLLQIVNGIPVVYVDTEDDKYPLSKTMRWALRNCGAYNIAATDGALEIRAEKDADFGPESVVLSGQDLQEAEKHVRTLLKQILSAKPTPVQAQQMDEVKVNPILADLKGQLLKMREAYAKAHPQAQTQTKQSQATTSSDMDAIRDMASMFR